MRVVVSLESAFERNRLFKFLIICPQNAVRHTLSLRKRFVRVPDPTRPYRSMWTISDEYQRNHLKIKSRDSRIKRKRISEVRRGDSQPMDLDEAAYWELATVNLSCFLENKLHTARDYFGGEVTPARCQEQKKYRAENWENTMTLDISERFETFLR